MRFRLLILFLLCAPGAFGQVSATYPGNRHRPFRGGRRGCDRHREERGHGHFAHHQHGPGRIVPIAVATLGRVRDSRQETGIRRGSSHGIQLVVGQEAIVNLALRLGQSEQSTGRRRECADREHHDGGHFGTGRRAAGQGSSAQRPQLRFADAPQSRCGELHLGENRRHRHLQFHDGQHFSVSGNRPQQNLFLLNGVEFTGAAENNMTPGGASGQLLGIDAVREFNILRDTYSAEYGKKPGGQVSIVTQSGTNQWHGSLSSFCATTTLIRAITSMPAPPRLRFRGINLAARWAARSRRTRHLCSPTTRDSARICTRPPSHLFPTRRPGWTLLPSSRTWAC